jgi:hypothetical protein
MTAGPLYYPGGSNTYVKDHMATGNLIASYSRNPKDFPLARYIQYREVKKDSGFYMRLGIEQAARLVGGSVDEYVWPDGADRPQRNNGTERFQFVDYRTERRDFDWQLGYKSTDQASWNIKDTEAANHAQQAMTARARRAHQKLENAANWDASHIIDVATIPGNSGRWDVSTTGRMDIKRSLNYGFDLIHQDTNGVINKRSDMILVISKKTAQRIGECQEMVNAFIQSVEARKHWENKEPRYNEWGIPDYLYGFEVVVEDTIMVTSKRGASATTRSPVCANGVGYILSRPGGLVSKANSGPSYSTLMCLTYEDMTVETLDDPKNRRIDGHVVDDTAEEIVSPVSGFVLQNLIA